MDDAERRKAVELLREIREIGSENQGGGENRLTWMYKGPNDMIDLEEYLLGRTIDKTFQGNTNGSNTEVLGRVNEPSNVPKRLLAAPESSEQVDIDKKILEDPLYAIKQKELEARRKLLDNPVKLKEIRKMIMEKHQKKMEKKKQKRKKSKDLANDENALNRKILKKLRILSESHRRKLLEEAAQSSDTESESDSKKRKKLLKKRKARNKGSSDSGSESDSCSGSEDSRGGMRKKRKSYIHKKERVGTRTTKASYNKRDYKTDRKDDSKRADKRSSSPSKHRRKTNRKDKRISKRKRNTSSSFSDSSSGSDSDSSASGKSSSETSSSESSRFKKKVKLRKEKPKDRGERRSIHKRKDNKRDTLGKREKNLPSDREEKRIKKDKKDRYHSDSYSFSDRKQNDRKDSKRYREDSPSKDRDRSENSRSSNHYTKINNYDRKYKERSPNACSSSVDMSEKERELKLREMMEDAKIRKEEREKNLARHRKIQSEEEKLKDYDDGFMRRQISQATSKGTMADRIKSNVNNIQRSKDDMDRSFMRK